MKSNICISCAQIHPAIKNKKENITKMKAYIDQVLADYPDTDLILFPELALTGCGCNGRETQAIAEPVNGPSIKELAQYAGEKNVYLVFGFIEREEATGSVYNSSVLIDRNGYILGQYRKMHLVEEEKALVEAGNLTYPVFDTDIGRIGMMICWDSAFPEVARILALNGADYILIPAAWEAPMQKDWDLVQSARAFDNVIFTACCNQAGKYEAIEFFGKSRITGPTGQILSDVIEYQEGIVSARFDFHDKKPLRDGYYALLRDRRPDTYADLISIKNERS